MGRLMRRGEVRWYKSPKPDKKRPIVILTRDSALEFLSEVIGHPYQQNHRYEVGAHECQHERQQRWRAAKEFEHVHE